MTAQIEHVIESFLFHHPEGDRDLVLRAYDFALSKHDGQIRRSGEPYITHPMSVAKIVADMGLCEPSICAALLHDVVEDTDTAVEEIRNRFGDDVAILVEGLTKLDTVEFVHREERQAESFRKMLIATVADIRVLLIKLADRLHNMSTLEALPQEKQERISQETRDIYAPLAGRLGLAWLKADLDDLAFKYLEPDAYVSLSAAVKRTRKRRIVFINRIKKELEIMIREKDIHHVRVSGRLKNLSSIHMKMSRKDLDYDRVHDAIAFRIVCESVEQCYLIFGLVHARWVPVPGLIKDYIAMPKANKYQSLHTTVMSGSGEKMEIQIRTREMDEVAEYGIAAHWAYKEERKHKASDVYLWLRSILDNQMDMGDSREFFDSVKVDLFHEEVFVFTPAGEVITLRAGATPLDFAYAIHSEVGNHCKGARVNGVIVPFDTALKNGDSVEILTAEDQRPHQNWLQIAKTSKARNRIKAYLRSEQREQSLRLGKELMTRALRKSGLSYGKVIKSGALDRLAPQYRLSSGTEIVAAIGYGKLDESAVVYELLPAEEQQEARTHIRESAFEKVLRKVKWQDDGIVIDGVDNIMVVFAKCCNPLPGEAVLGFVSRGRGIVVHGQHCPQAAHLEKERQIRVQWANDAAAKRAVKLKVVSGDRPGILAALSRVFDVRRINLASVHCEAEGQDGAVSTFVFPVENVGQLQELVKNLRQIKGVQEVTRIPH